MAQGGRSGGRVAGPAAGKFWSGESPRRGGRGAPSWGSDEGGATEESGSPTSRDRPRERSVERRAARRVDGCVAWGARASDRDVEGALAGGGLSRVPPASPRG